MPQEQPAPLSQPVLVRGASTDSTGKARIMSALKEQILTQASAQFAVRPTTGHQQAVGATHAAEPAKASMSNEDIFETVIIVRGH